jgi:hypothetical protein
MAAERFAFEFDDRFRLLLRVFGATEDNSVVAIDDDEFTAHFGSRHLVTPVSNLKSVQVTRGYQWFKAIGARGSLKDRGATFGTNTRAGVCVCFHEPVAALMGDRFRHPGLTVTVADIDGLVAAVERRLPA